MSKVSLEEVMSGLSPEALKQLDSGENVVTAHGTLIPVGANVAGCGDQLTMVVLSRVSPVLANDVDRTKDELKHAMAAWAMETSKDTPEKLPIVETALKAWKAFEDANDALLNMVVEDYFNVVKGYGAMPAITTKIQREAAGRAMHVKNDGARAKADAKKAAHTLWKERHAGKHPKLKTVEQFAIEVMARWPVLQSAKVICGWSAKWTKEAKADPNPAR